ncbi:helix-turn-helix domain-containing protein [Alicyclobacillus tolerans]|uniref:helix-turn-helix domain-containing protein n=1 Tax=Alicyclobacillus tolerans TaxID=90970 RepID=UPI001F1A45D7|nr:helix-turn-helix transcriptional regulator [Alicyclobacillus tolerans]MCF8565078.1 helix-turn-helix domain-containing protein [Alicyclobacillus tolerans]
MSNEIGKTIRKIRLIRQLSLTQLANLAGVTKSYVSYIERNPDSNPSVDVLERLCNALEVDVDFVLQPEGNSSQKTDWLDLIQYAQLSGITKQQFQEFIQRQLVERRVRKTD